MTTTPILGLTELAEAQAIPEVTVNETVRWLEFFAAGGGIIDRDVADESTLTPSDGDAYLVAGSAEDDWSGHDGEIALYISTAWAFKEPVEGMSLYVADEDVRIDYDGAAWNEIGGGSSSTTVTTQAGTTYTLDADDANSVILFTNAGGCDVTVPDGVFAVGDFIELHQQTTGTVAVLDNGTSTVNSRDGMAFLTGQYSVAGIRCTATNVFNLTGDLEATS